VDHEDKTPIIGKGAKGLIVGGEQDLGPYSVSEL
jgi:hypothetical protein